MRQGDGKVTTLATQEMPDFCAEHGIAPDVQLLPIQEISEAYEKVKSGDVRFSYVIDAASLAPAKEDAETA